MAPKNIYMGLQVKRNICGSLVILVFALSTVTSQELATVTVQRNLAPFECTVPCRECGRWNLQLRLAYFLQDNVCTYANVVVCRPAI